MRVGYLKVYVYLCRNDAGFFTWQYHPVVTAENEGIKRYPSKYDVPLNNVE